MLTTEKNRKHDKTKGMAEAFYFFADYNAVIKRDNKTLIKSNDEIKNSIAIQII